MALATSLPISLSLQVQQKAIRCIQSNVRQFLQVREWEWWRLYTKVNACLILEYTENQRDKLLEQIKYLSFANVK